MANCKVAGLSFAGRHFWNRKCRKKTWWQQKFAVFKCEATANSVTGHVCVYNNESVTVYETLDGKRLKNGTPHSRYFSDELGVPIILIDTEQMFVLQRDAWYNINVNIVYWGCRTKVRQLRVFIQHKTPSFEKPGVCGIISLCY